MNFEKGFALMKANALVHMFIKDMINAVVTKDEAAHICAMFAATVLHNVKDEHGEEAVRAEYFRMVGEYMRMIKDEESCKVM